MFLPKDLNTLINKLKRSICDITFRLRELFMHNIPQ